MDLMNKGKKCGKIIVRAERTGISNDLVKCIPCVSEVESQRWFSDTKPFLRMFKSTEDNQNIKVYESIHRIKSVYVKYPLVSIKMTKLCNEDRLRPISLEVWDYHSDGGHKLIGVTKFTVEQAENQARQKCTLKLEVKGKKSGKKVGTVHLEQFQVIKRPSFIEYVRGGTELSLIGAIDFTGSNGVASARSSLHYINQNNPNEMNPY